jgi:hypothetical protein
MNLTLSHIDYIVILKHIAMTWTMAPKYGMASRGIEDAIASAARWAL